MNERVDSYRAKRTLKMCLEAWASQNMLKNKTKIKN